MPSGNINNQAPRHVAVQRVAGMGLSSGVANFDGTSDRASTQGGSKMSSQQGPGGSTKGSPRGSRAGQGSRTGSPGRPPAGRSTGGSPTRPPGGPGKGPGKGPGNFPPSLGYDPAKPAPGDTRGRRGRDDDRRPLTLTDLVGKRIDLPADAFRAEREFDACVKRPGYNTEGRQIKVNLNLYPVTAWPTSNIYQYDVNVSPNPDDRSSLTKKVWNSESVQKALVTAGARWLFDGNKLAWCSKEIPKGELRLQVDLDALAGKSSLVGKSGVYRIQVKKSTKITMEYLRAYLDGKSSWDNHVLQCINHLLRQYPSENLERIKRNFYPRDAEEHYIDQVIAVRKGVYTTFRLSQFGQGSIHKGLAVNVDLVNTTFWKGMDFISKMVTYMVTPKAQAQRRIWLTIPEVIEVMKPKRFVDKQGNVSFIKSTEFKILDKLRRCKFYLFFPGKTGNKRIYTIMAFTWNLNNLPNGAHAGNTMIRPKENGVEGPEISVKDFLETRYKRVVRYWELPLIITTKGGFFPMESCKLVKFQRYQFKLNPEETAAMIKIAVTKPAKRTAEIKECVEFLKWAQDPYFKEYGLTIGSDMISSNAMLIKNPEIFFASGKHDPKMQGRWDLRGKRFIEPNILPLKSWGFIGCGDDSWCITPEQLKAFADGFVRTYKSHGGKIMNPPYTKCYTFHKDWQEMCHAGYYDTGRSFGMPPQLVFYVVSTRNMLVYERIKKNMDCRYCTMSQVLLFDHVKKNNDQYRSNVAMKVNAKLGGATCRAVPSGTKTCENPPYYGRPTMFIGVDVSHASPGSSQPSMAAMTMSMDKFATKWAAKCQTNNYRTEAIHQGRLRWIGKQLLTHWNFFVKVPPQHIYYFRDGVDEGQFSKVIESEIVGMKRVMKDMNFPEARWTVIVATKRHHIRFFPGQGGDRNGNPLPGTVVERDATHPFNWDFFLCSHVAIQGTARPVHYNVILDEAKCNPNDLQRMIYHMCYQYVRSTTPVSLHPAIYYAHLASQRARAHEDIPSFMKFNPAVGKAGFPMEKDDDRIYDEGDKFDSIPLIPMESKEAHPPNIRDINSRMWFV